MPSHIFTRIGERETAIKINNLAIEDDRAYLKDSGMQGLYPVKYYNHNLHFLSMDYSMAGQFADALKVAQELVANYAGHFQEMPSMEFFMPTPMFVLLRWSKWDDLLRLPEPKKEMAITNALWHFGRGMAYAASGFTSDAQAERKIFSEATVRIPDDAEFGNNSASSILNIAQLVLDSQIAIAKHDRRQAIELLKKAVEAEDALNYDEPPNWFFPIRESLGSVLMQNGNYEEAEQVFQADLERNPCNGRSLFGLFNSLEAQGKNSAAQRVKTEFDIAWKNADTQLSVEEL
jgi:predicted Zn-dependent protease